jgi:hypothetical protein
MTVKEMHYDFKAKFNALDSQKNRDFLVPELDAKLCEAQDFFVKLVAQPRLQRETGFELNQRSIDDIRTIVIDQKLSNAVTTTKFDDNSYIANLPTDYWFYVNSNVYATKGKCMLVKMRRTILVQHDDEHETNPFYKSSFEWGEINVNFNSEGLRLYTDGTFTIDKVAFQYLKQPSRIHNAEDWRGGSYKTLDGVVLTGTQDCKLPVGVHREIVDIAVMLTAGDLGLATYGIKKDKVALNQLP